MSDTVKSKTRLKTELVILICVIFVWIIMLLTTDIYSTKVAVSKTTNTTRLNSDDLSVRSRESFTNSDEFHFFPLLDEEKIHNNIEKTKSVTFGLITGICRSIDKPLAVINNKMVVYEGDTIDDITIIKIYKEKVEFIKNGKNYVKEIIRFP